MCHLQPIFRKKVWRVGRILEYEPCKKAIQSPDGLDSFARDGFMLLEVNGKKTADCQPAIAGNRIFFSGPGASVAGTAPSLLFYIYTDGSTDIEGLHGLPLFQPGASHLLPRFATSPDGKTIYMILFGMGDQQGAIGIGPPAVYKRATGGKDFATVFVGAPKRPGNDNRSFNSPMSLDCDSAGRVYVCDYANNRIQVFSPEGNYLKTIPSDRPFLIRVHARTGAIYVFHKARREGQTINRLTKFKNLDDPREEFHVDDLTASAFTIDSWLESPRLWLAGNVSSVNTAGAFGTGPSVTIWEDDGRTLRKIMDFDEEAKKTAGANYIGRFSAASVGPGGKVTCDPTREEVYWEHTVLFDLRTGALKGRVKIPGVIDDMIVDRRGFLHVHLNPGFDTQGVVRYDPGQRTFNKDKREFICPEVPYDYGIERPGHYGSPRKGVLPVKDQPGAKFFQDGIGVNMRGDVAENCNVYYVPKFEDYGKETALSSTALFDMQKRNEFNSSIGNKYAEYKRKLLDWEKRGEEIYSIPRRPGYELAGATIWTFDRSGELRTKAAAVLGKHIAGVHIDDDNKLYFVISRTKYVNSKPFLAGKTGIFGGTAFGSDKAPFTGTLVKSREKDVAFLSPHALIPLEPLPSRPKDVVDGWMALNGYMQGHHQ